MKRRTTITLLLASFSILCSPFSLSCLAQRAADPGTRFKSLDADGDGKVTREEAGHPRWFDRFDRDGDGAIAADEIPNRPVAATPPAAESDVRTLPDLAYGKHASQKLDVYLPDTPVDAPVMLYIHGGGWRKGDKAAVGQKAAFFTGRGWIFISANYRLIPGGEHPKNVEDVASAIAWAHAHAEEHGGNPESIFIMGHSAGCHLVSLAATDARPLGKHDLPLSVIKGVIALDTQAYDIPRLSAETPSDLYAGVFGEDPEVQRDASPLHHVAKEKGIPPFLICYSSGMGGRPNAMRPVYANAFRDALRAAGVPAEVVDASDRNHGEINQRFGDPHDEKVTGKAMRFLENIPAGP